MRWYVPILAVVSTVLLCAGMFNLKASTKEVFPDEPVRNVLFQECTQCHSLGKMVTAELTADEWEFLVYDMVARGAPVHQEDLSALITYLQNSFATDKK